MKNESGNIFSAWSENNTFVTLLILVVQRGFITVHKIYHYYLWLIPSKDTDKLINNIMWICDVVTGYSIILNVACTYNKGDWWEGCSNKICFVIGWECPQRFILLRKITNILLKGTILLVMFACLSLPFFPETLPPMTTRVGH